MRKNEIVTNVKFKYLVGEERLVQFELSDHELKGDYRINHLLNNRLEDKFYDSIPWKHEGQALGNKEAGLVFQTEQKQIANLDSNKANFNLKKNNLKDSIVMARNTSTSISKQTEEFLLEVFKKRQEKYFKSQITKRKTVAVPALKPIENPTLPARLKQYGLMKDMEARAKFCAG